MKKLITAGLLSFLMATQSSASISSNIENLSKPSNPSFQIPLEFVNYNKINKGIFVKENFKYGDAFFHAHYNLNNNSYSSAFMIELYPYDESVKEISSCESEHGKNMDLFPIIYLIDFNSNKKLDKGETLLDFNMNGLTGDEEFFKNSHH